MSFAGPTGETLQTAPAQKILNATAEVFSQQLMLTPFKYAKGREHPHTPQTHVIVLSVTAAV